ncbi:MAG: hypothetical protein COT06_01405 [Syntrophobacteraceae bacterium CG07_land_8_20_14_0_80_61_8]|nr:MAG: hypothetical protein COT06_01405 [Syntrophobacteraceae bacterium CG07_land_8_20_14_0_80_61_8]
MLEIHIKRFSKFLACLCGSELALDMRPHNIEQITWLGLCLNNICRLSLYLNGYGYRGSVLRGFSAGHHWRIGLWRLDPTKDSGLVFQPPSKISTFPYDIFRQGNPSALNETRVSVGYLLAGAHEQRDPLVLEVFSGSGPCAAFSQG